eukprot:6207220-Pyramimonas_sp.AAC.1
MPIRISVLGSYGQGPGGVRGRTVMGVAGLAWSWRASCSWSAATRRHTPPAPLRSPPSAPNATSAPSTHPACVAPPSRCHTPRTNER